MTKLCVFTSTRADFGILSPLIAKIEQSQDIELRLFVTGTHLLEEHGNTVGEIRRAGFEPY
ncbi:MAG TPA: UDP-N-acetylglucosamine 2-epimerase (hydrolyzing), partial [Bdellovibrio sp.]|nr:UDP-N-acetylglucosamine 2-epimerase (hydrolyzing) [Bdellovibrio sp.]